MLRGLDRLKLVLQDLPLGAKLVLSKNVAERLEIYTYTSCDYEKLPGILILSPHDNKAGEWVFERVREDR